MRLVPIMIVLLSSIPHGCTSNSSDTSEIHTRSSDTKLSKIQQAIERAKRYVLKDEKCNKMRERFIEKEVLDPTKNENNVHVMNGLKLVVFEHNGMRTDGTMIGISVFMQQDGSLKEVRCFYSEPSGRKELQNLPSGITK